jgi:hypothetical protein
MTAIAGTLAGCGSSDPGTAATPTTVAPTTTEPTAIVTDAAVTAGLAQTRAQAAKVKVALASGGTDAAKAESKAMYELWYGFEATVRQNEKALYLQMEDGLADIQGGARDNKPERIDKGLQDLEEGATAYLEKHP